MRRKSVDFIIIILIGCVFSDLVKVVKCFVVFLVEKLFVMFEFLMKLLIIDFGFIV